MRGKSAEKEVDSLFKMWNISSKFAYQRMPDARAAGGRLAAQVADFIVSTAPEGPHWLEVKETASMRLARDKVKQLPSLKKFHLAGMPYLVLVYQTKLDRWLLCPPEFFTDSAAPSWSLKDVTQHLTPESALSTVFNQTKESK
jgi:hypothetical protein